MFLNIITPCTRPNNLHDIAKTINIPRDSYRWIVVFDAYDIPKVDIPQECEAYAIKVEGSIYGNGQRNHAIDKVENGHIYFNDDDTTIHPYLWENVNHLNVDFISFSQEWKDRNMRLKGNLIEVGSIDSHNFIVSKQCVGDKRWNLDEYESDGIFAKQCYQDAASSTFIPKVLSIYNSLK